MPASWLAGDRGAAAADHILDAAGRCFARQGATRTSIGDIAREAGCSRPTIYRYFDDRDALRTAYVHREARRVSSQVLGEISSIADPGQRLAAAMLASVAAVRTNPTLAAWFAVADAGVASHVANSSAVIESLVAPLLGNRVGDDGRRALWARWVVRIILSLLTTPGIDAEEERTMIEQLVVPVVADTIDGR